MIVVTRCSLFTFFNFTLMFYCPGDQQGANRQSTKQYVRLRFPRHSLRKPPHAFGSELVKRSETEKAEKDWRTLIFC